MSLQATRELIKQEIARREFWEFCMFMDEPFFNRRIFLKEIADTFQEIIDGKIRTVSISMPPRAGKSYITTLFCAYYIGLFPLKTVMRNCATTDLYRKFSYQAREILKSDRYKLVFPQVQLSDDRSNIDAWSIKGNKTGSYFGGGVGRNIIGSGASIAITDDLYPGIFEALSAKYNETLWMWKQGSHDSRMEKGCPEIDISTRWSINDMIGVNLEKGKYDKVICISATIDGHSFCEDVKTTEEYKRIQSDIDEYIWLAEYMQEPIEAKGLVFNRDDLNYFVSSDLRYEDVIAVNGFIDTADEGDDDLCYIIGRNVGAKIFITDILYTKDGTDITLPLCAEMSNRIMPNYTTVESNSGGRAFAKQLRQLVKGVVLMKSHHSNKHTRILMEAGFIKKYFYFRSDYDPGSDYDKFMKCLCTYVKTGDSKHDDAPDASAGLAAFIRKMLSGEYTY